MGVLDIIEEDDVSGGYRVLYGEICRRNSLTARRTGRVRLLS